MDHTDATRLMATDQYLLHELAPEVRDEFEEHLFGCPECALDLRSGAAFVQQVKIVLPEFEGHVAAAAPAPRRQSRPFGWMLPAFSMATALLLIVLGYQNFVTTPKLQREVALANVPQVLPSVSLVSARDTSVPEITAQHNGAALIFLDIPAEHVFPSYVAELHDQAGKLQWSLPIAGGAAKDTVSIQIPSSPSGSGLYTLVLSGIETNPERRTEIRQYKFQLKYEN
ncbi:MAG TPA: zf-HC2 domain-containing protein [Terriglobales bacterium]|jgi:hypothetical protein